MSTRKKRISILYERQDTAVLREGKAVFAGSRSQRKDVSGTGAGDSVSGDSTDFQFVIRRNGARRVRARFALAGIQEDRTGIVRLRADVHQQKEQGEAGRTGDRPHI
ncbi:hypothetical protein [Herbaspirillum sp.]|uniref:hypothetical protein n=1 Tax=Herbaspirillum sp. TaxID=1890675 RepID=UPI0031CF76C0